jgi:hypothetical protein
MSPNGVNKRFFLMPEDDERYTGHPCGTFSFFNHIKGTTHRYRVVTPSMTLYRSIVKPHLSDPDQVSKSNHYYSCFMRECEEMASRDLKDMPLFINDPTWRHLVQDRLRDGY